MLIYCSMTRKENVKDEEREAIKKTEEQGEIFEMIKMYSRENGIFIYFIFFSVFVIFFKKRIKKF